MKVKINNQSQYKVVQIHKARIRVYRYQNEESAARKPKRIGIVFLCIILNSVTSECERVITMF